VTAGAAGTRPNLVPGEYRGVAVADVPCPLDAPSLAAHLVGREAYRRTRFIVVRQESDTAVVAVEKESAEPLFAPVTAVELLVGPADCVFLHRPDLDTAVPGHLARAAREDAPGVRGVVVQGRYGHVSFIIDPEPLRVTVREVVPPRPPKLVDQASRLLDVAENLPPIELVSELVHLSELAGSRPSAAYLLPCRGGGVAVAGASTWYLDERPARRPWVLVGCERSQQIHEWFYGERAEQVDMCPRKAGPSSGPVLTKCCLLEREVVVEENRVVVPWGATLDQISDALRELVKTWEPSWAPA
jgi:hypothetical protein